MNRVIVTTILFLTSLTLQADGFFERCKFSRSIEQQLDLSDSESLSLLLGAGDLEVEGIPGADRAVITGRICASKESWLDESRIETTVGADAIIESVLPDNDTSWSIWGSRYAYIDLVIQMPNDLALNIRDSSGDLEVQDVAAVTIKDSSGDILVQDSTGPVDIEDTSGDIRVRRLDQGFAVTDSSGDINAEDIGGSVHVRADSSGDMVMKDVAGDVLVDRDSSGDIVAKRIGGDFTVARDGSGDIASIDITGAVDIPQNKQ